MTNREVYISVDVETDGPVPGPYSMVSIGASAAFILYDGGRVEMLDVDDPTNQFYAELKPISDKWDPEALAISGLTREYIEEHGQDPKDAMSSFVAWVKGIHEREGCRVVFTAFPLGFDWIFTYWYLIVFAEESPFGFSSHRDMKTEYASRGNTLISRASKRLMPKKLMSNRKHTHNPLDDAIEQGEMMANILQWRAEGKRENG